MKKIRPYLQAFPDIFIYQIIIHICLLLCSVLHGWIFRELLQSDGRVALTGSDALFLVTTWQGWTIIILFILLLFVYVTFELGTMILFSEKRLNGEKYSIWLAIKTSVLSMKKLCSLRGVAIVLFIAFVLPLIGAGVSISVTQNMYIPNFIKSVIDSTPAFSIGYTILMIVLAIVFVLYIFSLHTLLLGETDKKNIFKTSRQLVIKNIGNFILETILFLLIMVIAYIIIAGATFAIYMLFLYMFGTENRIVMLFFTLLIAIESFIIISFAMPLYIMKVTQLFEKYRAGGAKQSYPILPKQRTAIKYVAICALVLLLGGLGTLAMNLHFDLIFPNAIHTGIIAHRAGGAEAPENTVAGLEKAIELGAIGGEIDIQRTKDGHYVVNHDATFERVAGVDRTPEEMTLDEVKELRVEGKEPVATYEEMLDASKGRIKLFVELKGETADKQMADDAVRMIKERGMEKEAIIISLKYDLIEYIEEKYNEMLTGYLCFATFGDTASLNCDFLAVEEESATDETLESILDQGKRAIIWTVNKEEDQYRFFQGTAYALITDEVSLAQNTTATLKDRSEMQRIIDVIWRLFGTQ